MINEFQLVHLWSCDFFLNQQQQLSPSPSPENVAVDVRRVESSEERGNSTERNSTEWAGPDESEDVLCGPRLLQRCVSSMRFERSSGIANLQNVTNTHCTNFWDYWFCIFLSF
jgi:hypothetical protein